MQVFMDEAGQLLREFEKNLLAIADGRLVRDPIAGLLRPIHTLRGAAEVYGAREFAALAAEIEELLREMSGDSSNLAKETIRALQHAAASLSQLREQECGGEHADRDHVRASESKIRAARRPPK